jgi:hypothetical protein
MTELVRRRVYRTLLDLGVAAESAATLLNGGWLDAKQWRLGTFGGKRHEVLETEMTEFREAFAKPGLSYRLFKYFGWGRQRCCCRHNASTRRENGMRNGRWGATGRG